MYSYNKKKKRAINIFTALLKKNKNTNFKDLGKLLKLSEESLNKIYLEWAKSLPKEEGPIYTRILGAKTEPYYKNEDDYGTVKNFVYNYEDLLKTN
jgi:hypothetical protein